MRSTDVMVALAAGERRLDPPQPLSVDLRNRAPVQLAIVALAQTRVPANRQAGPGESDLGRLDGAAQVGGEDDLDPVVAPALAKRLRGGATALGEEAGNPAGRDPGLVVGRERVGLVDELDHLSA